MEASISFCRAMRACHQSACSFFVASGHLASASRGISHSCQVLLERGVQLLAQGSSFACHWSQMTSISALLAMDLSVMCGTRS
jgi:hypothetical protein